ncbi:MAG TPA: LptF/LptG family permease [Pirellulales bacterium]|nr:LptF/LptG family permease [Pirellulales bacterium]
MSVINRLILFELIKVTLIALFGMTAVLIFSDVVKQLQNQGLGMFQIVQALPFLLPYALRTSLQGALLFAVCSVYGRMAASNEIIAIKSMGISPMQVTWPALLALGIPMSLFCVWLDDVGAAWGQRGLQRVIIQSTDEVAYGMLRTQRSFSKKHFAIAVKNVEGRKLIRPTLTYEPPGETHVVTIVAEDGELRVDRKQSRLTILMRSGKIFVPGQFEMSFDDTIEQTLPIDTTQGKPITPQLIAEQRERVETLHKNLNSKSFTDLLKDRALAYRYQSALQRYHTEERYLSWMLTKFHQKWANSFCCLAFVAIGIPVAVRMRRGDFMTSFMLCFVPIVSAYQPLQFVGSSLAQSGQVPAYAVWFGNVILFGVAAWLLRKVNQH